MHKIFITRSLMPVARELLSQHFTIEENLLNEPVSREKLKQAFQECDGILTTIPDKIDKEILEHAEKVRVISNCAAGLDNIDVAAAEAKKITVFNVPDATTESTADLTFAILLSLIRQVGAAREFVKEGRWRGWEPALFLGEELAGKNFGILGYGKIGKAVAERARGFGLHVCIYARKKIDDPHVTQMSLEELYRKSDYLSIHLPLTPDTSGMINLKAFKQMTRKPIVINIARGGIIKTDDLVTALMENMIRGAVLDVTDPEPINPAHPLCHMENCLILPHIGSATVECRTVMAKKAAENLIRFFND